MQDVNHTISADHHEKLDQKFEHIAHLIENDKLTEAVPFLLQLHYADLADFLDNTNRKDYQVIFPAIAAKIESEVLIWLSDSNKQPAIEALGVKASAALIDQLDIEDSIEVIEALDQELKDQLIAMLRHDKKQQIIEGFKYPENTAGRILEKNFVALKQHWTAKQAVDFIRQTNITADFYAAIIIDSRLKPIGTILLSTLLKSESNMPLSDLMNKEFMVVDTNTKVEELAFIFKQYALTIVPVTNKQGKLVGNISINNMLYIIEEQTENEFLHLGGLNNSDIFYDLYPTVKSRFPWLFINLVTACLTSLVINHFNDTIAKLITVAAMMPIVASMGGNAGTQVMTVTVRAIANREFTSVNNMRVITKEIYVCALNGILLAIIGGAITYLFFAEAKLSSVFAISVFVNFALAGFLGSFIPIILNEMNMDPTTASGVLMTACTDAISFFTFLGLAYYFLV